MKKETINTFQKGMIKDLHPLTTPNDVLTDALNGTLITYNGNEGALQNDMGNVKIKNALLKAGYVPVGMKEHGGIIYVAAYNPTTKKGQIGSFPSPKQLWEGEDWNINKPANITTTVTIPSNMYDGNYIIKENVKQAIFTSANGEARIFHPGDKYIIGFPAKENLASSVENGYVDIQLGVVKADGGIEIMRTWSKDSNGDFLYGGDEASLSTYLSDVSKVQVFDASSSGEMILIINLNTLDSFNLLREYSMVQVSENNNTVDKIKVTFTGEATKGNEILSSKTENGYLKLAIASNNYDNDQIEVVEGNAIPSMIYPNVPFGIVQRMGRSVNLDFEKIRKNQDDFGEWRFFVTDTYVKIGWAYDFYNLDGSKKIEYIRMYFHKLEDEYTAENKENLPHIDFQKESYNGNFEEYITYSDIGLQYRRIYIVEIVKKLTGESEQIIDFKMLYLSKLYNSSYNGFYTNNTIGLAGESASAMDRQALEYSCIPEQSIGIKLSPTIETELIDSNTKIQCPNEVNYNIPTVDVKPNMYITPISDLDMSQADSYQYLTNVTNEYKNKFKISGELEGLSELYLGKPKDTLIHDLLNTYSINSIEIDRSEKTWQKSSTLKQFPSVTEPLHTDDYTVDNVDKEYLMDSETTVEENTLILDNIKFKDNRFIQGFISDVKSATYESKGLKPLYAPDYTLDKRNKVAPYWNVENTLCMSGAGDGSHKTIHYNSTIMPAGYVVEGPDAGGGCDDGGLFTASNYMGRPMTNIFSGDHGEDAELVFNSLRENSAVASGANSMDFISSHTENGGQFLDWQGDNYLIACWKFTDGDSRFVNLLTKRNIPAKSTLRWPRLDVILKCILSQIFIVNRIQKKTEYVTTNEGFYQYQQGTTKIRISLSQNSTGLNNIINDVMVSEDDNVALSTHFTNNWGNGTFTTGGKTYNITNLIPTINATNPDITEAIELEIPNFYDLDVLLGYYLGTTYNTVEDNTNDLDIKAIYKLDVAERAYNASVCAKTEGEGNSIKPKANLDGAYEWLDTPKCSKLDNTNNGTLSIYRWNDSDVAITFPGFFNHFTTRASELNWEDIPDNEDNEVYAKTSNVKTSGKWTDAADKNAPDMYYTTLYSPAVSALKNALN